MDQEGLPCPSSVFGHSAVAGMMYVHAEDLATVAESRRNNGSGPVECEHCDMVYNLDKGWVYP